MRKDYIEVSQNDEREIAFVEKYWTKVWEQEGGPGNKKSQIQNKEEYLVMSKWLSHLPLGSNLLDGGCGLGEWTDFFTQQGYPTLGLDISRDTILQLQSLLPNLDFRVGDIRDTGIADASIDGYFSWGTFEHFESGLSPCINEAFRILKPGGLLFTSVPFDNLRHALRAACDWKRKENPERQKTRFYQWRLTRGEFRHQLAQSGFEVLAIHAIGKRQGVLRSLQHEFGLNYKWFFSRALSAAVAPFIPSGLIAHMLIAVARKPL